jgi:hypothetical protein
MKTNKVTSRAENPTAQRLQTELRAIGKQRIKDGGYGERTRLSNKLGLPNSNLSTLLHHGRNMTLQTFCNLADALGFEISLITKEQAGLHKLYLTTPELDAINEILSQRPIVPNLTR